MIARLVSVLDRAQRARAFKIIASCVVVGFALAVAISYSVAAERARQDAFGVIDQGLVEPRGEGAAPGAGPEGADNPTTQTGAPAAAQRPEEAVEATRRVLRGLVTTQHSVAGVWSGAALVAGIGLAVIWIGLGLTYLALALACGAALGVAHLLGVGRAAAPALVGLVALTASFTALMRLAGLLVSGSGPVLSIARMVLLEAVRMRVSLVFIFLMLLGLAALPLLLTPDQPLRYRVQAFLQYGLGLSYMLIALLVVVFSVATVATEQRGKQIWQTMTKPVSAWEYIAGKWAGVGILSLVLLLVASTGIFVFTEYLRRQPAVGEVTAFRPTDQRLITEDRLLLETQVLTARQRVLPEPPQLDQTRFEQEVEERVRTEITAMGPYAGATPQDVERARQELERTIRESLSKTVILAYRAVEPGSSRVFVFEGLGAARDGTNPIVLRYKVNAGSNMPDALYSILIGFPAKQAGEVVQIPLAQTLTLQLSPDMVDDAGRLTLEIFNGDPRDQATVARQATLNFPPDGLEVTYSVGSFTANYFRCIAVLWAKLLFMSMVGIVCATFLSFSVASLVSITTFFTAEGARFLLDSLENYSTADLEGKPIYFNIGIAMFAEFIGTVFRVYADLRPTTRLVEGEVLAWTSVAGGSGVLALWTVALFGIGVAVMRRRELAIYSGQ